MITIVYYSSRGSCTLFYLLILNYLIGFHSLLKLKEEGGKSVLLFVEIEQGKMERIYPRIKNLGIKK